MPNKLSVCKYICVYIYIYSVNNGIYNGRGREIHHVDTAQIDSLPQLALEQKSKGRTDTGKPTLQC